jgi:hypothetical protein
MRTPGGRGFAGANSEESSAELSAEELGVSIAFTNGGFNAIPVQLFLAEQRELPGYSGNGASRPVLQRY